MKPEGNASIDYETEDGDDVKLLLDNGQWFVVRANQGTLAGYSIRFHYSTGLVEYHKKNCYTSSHIIHKTDRPRVYEFINEFRMSGTCFNCYNSSRIRKFFEHGQTYCVITPQGEILTYEKSPIKGITGLKKIPFYDKENAV